jgi:hypothetical protein
MSKIQFVVGLPFSIRQRRLAEIRAPLSKDEFTIRIASSEIGKKAADMLWCKLKESAMVEEFTPYPEDDLLHTYGLAEEDLDEDIILAIITCLGVSAPRPDLVRKIGPIRTPIDVIRLIEAEPAT